MADNDYGHAERSAALALPEAELRRRLDVLLEQCGREALHFNPAARHRAPVAAPYLYVSEILMLLGVGPTVRQEAVEALSGMIEEDDRVQRPLDPETQRDIFRKLGYEPDDDDIGCGAVDPDDLDACGNCPDCRPSVDDIRPSTPGDDAKREAFEASFPGYCADGTCGTCGACELRKDEGS